MTFDGLPMRRGGESAQLAHEYAIGDAIARIRSPKATDQDKQLLCDLYLELLEEDNEEAFEKLSAAVEEGL